MAWRTARISSIMSSPSSYDSSVILSIVFTQELERGDERGNEDSQRRVHTLDMIKLTRICKMAAVPRQQEITPVVRSECEMKRVTDRVGRHESVTEVRSDDLGNGG